MLGAAVFSGVAELADAGPCEAGAAALTASPAVSLADELATSVSVADAVSVTGEDGEAVNVAGVSELPHAAAKATARSAGTRVTIFALMPV